MYEIHSHSITQKYRAHVCSLASIFNVLSLAITYILPLLIAYFSQGFWLKESTYREQAEVNFKHQFILLLQGTDVNTLITYSTYQNYNNLMADHVRVPFIQSYETDNNRDGKNDVLNFEIQVPTKSTENIHSVQLLLLFDYKLHRFSTVQMESMAYIYFSSPIPGAEFSTEGDLKLNQKYLLPYRGVYTTYNVPVVTSTSIHIEDYDLTSIFSKYQTRNISTDYISYYPVWKAGRVSDSPFILKGKIHYPEETITYRPGFWQLIKMAWIQYLAVLFIFLYVFTRIRRSVFESQIVLTVPQKVNITSRQS
eukprot:Seg5184.1 transcript_id=Seg5184.1/GoldUCD/mRNA.D3Y31 product="Transmembrane protein 231" protein_id=Seg5184.1/GoldUCD/D3Y31